MNKYSLTKLSNLQIAMLGSMGGYLLGVVNDEFEFKKGSLKSVAKQLLFMVDLATKQNEEEELELSHHSEQWYKRMEEACRAHSQLGEKKGCCESLRCDLSAHRSPGPRVRAPTTAGLFYDTAPP